MEHLNDTAATPTDPGWDLAVDATSWFNLLMHARWRDNFGQAVEAETELERLGIVVRFRRRVGFGGVHASAGSEPGPP